MDAFSGGRCEALPQLLSQPGTSPPLPDSGQTALRLLGFGAADEEQVAFRHLEVDLI